MLTRSDVCVVCGRALAVGDEAVWDRSRATLTCLECHPAPPPPLSEGSAGASALREYERRRDRTGLVDAVELQVGYVRTALHGVRFPDPVEIRGALCFPGPEGLPLVSGLKVREVVIDGPKDRQVRAPPGTAGLRGDPSALGAPDQALPPA